MLFLLVHSPAVGPSTWRWVADSLRSQGHDVVVPSLIPAAQAGDPSRFAEAAAASVNARGEPAVIVGHSGAGPLLPVAAAAMRSKPRFVVFVDAGVPPCEGRSAHGDEILSSLRDLAKNGVLPPWSEWWGDGVLEAMIPDDARRRTVEAELPRVPLSFYEATLDMPSNWGTSRCAYVLVSDAYREDARRAGERGWVLVDRPGMHLDIVNDGDGFAQVILEVIEG
jgi:hypothetical protein